MSKKTQNQALTDLVKQWDALEILVITIFKSKTATLEDKAVYQQVRQWFATEYTVWQPKLQPHWQNVVAGGEVVTEDPFLQLVSADSAESFVGNWRAMQLLAAARETLNKLLVAEGKA